MEMGLWFTLSSILISALAVLVALSQLPTTTSGRRWRLAILSLLVLAVGLGVVGYVKRPMVPMAVTFSQPSSATHPIAPKTTVGLVGTLRNLPKGHELWIVSKPFDTASFYYVVAGRPATHFDGNWNLEDKEIGDKSDLGKGFYYYPVDADQECSLALSAVPSPRRLFKNHAENNPNFEATKWPPSCVLHLEASTIIRFKAK